VVNKSIDLGNGLKFASITTGKMHFDSILKDTALGAHVAPLEFTQINDLYEAYCRKTDWPINSPPAAFFPMHERGKGYTTRCFGVAFKDGSTGRFSLDKALSAVAG
jgi:hypothetical protein